MIKVNDNCYPPTSLGKNQKDKSAPSFSTQNDVSRSLYLTLGEFLGESEKQKANKLISFFDDVDKHNNTNDKDELIVAITHGELGPLIQTGNYLGKFRHKEVDFDIRSRFSDIFLKRMLNFANDVYLDDVDVFGKQANEHDFSRFILYYLFVQSLEKAYLLGLPKAYQSVRHHEMRLKGQLDINRYIKQDIPFTGKVSSVAREFKEIQEIVDVLHKAVKVIEHAGNGMTKNIAHIKPHLREAASGDFVSRKTITKAQNCKALLNPIFSQYKKVLRYAEYIIQLNSLQESVKESKDQYFGFLVNVAELFEIYVTKLLRKEFPEWDISSPKLDLYDDMFYARKIIPDIVMRRDNDILVFDTKYKKMEYKGRNKHGMGDVDRSDFFQINTYMTYYQQQNMNLKCGGLIYPLSADHDKEKCHAGTWLGNKQIGFVVDGIQVGENILAEEKAFISRVEVLIKPLHSV
jgi:5-methylcytosine-specific restriction endonuclease McrBC regulatory subunit McrC